MEICPKCKQLTAKPELIGLQHFILCRSVECGGPTGCRPLTGPHPNEDLAYAEYRREVRKQQETDRLEKERLAGRS